MGIRSSVIAILCLLLGASGSPAGTDKDVLSPPAWIMGSWSNFAESHESNIDTFTFREQEVLAREGVHGEEIDLVERYGRSGFSEEIKPDFYRIVLKSERGEAIYEFRLLREGGNSGQQVPVMTVSVVIFGVMHRYASESINHCYTRR